MPKSSLTSTWTAWTFKRKQLHLKGLPSAVVQYNEWKDGDLIAVSFEARKYGVKCRGSLSTNELVQVPVARGKADLITYQNALWVQRKGRCEGASIDKVYLDLTDAAEAMLAETPLERLEVADEEVLRPQMLGLRSEVKDPAFPFSVIFHE
ncbi:hypothetical protein Pint_11994 [Pistacia integerrima]|uniref:Uncharacterized protein n=1 Tax=Pistacia integerrima TaxID=434235 RepID=A0ACC0XM67_9ROSI|nr:hypothetical protein Pint_11994 [Pistacia integerrima]